MAKRERIEKLMEILRERSALPIRELARELQVSEMTVRRDATELGSSGEVEITQGVIFYRGKERSPGTHYELTFQQGIQRQEKDRIGSRAAAMVETGDVIFIDIGTTAAYVARHIPPGMNVTVVCFTMNSLVELQKKNISNLIVSGGFYHRDTQTFECSETMDMVSNIRASKAFLVPAGASMEMGLTCVNQYETRVKQICLNNAVEKILLVDSSKFGRVSPVYFADWSQIDKVITDEGIPQNWRDFLAEKGVRLIIAE